MMAYRLYHNITIIKFLSPFLKSFIKQAKELKTLHKHQRLFNNSYSLLATKRKRWGGGGLFTRVVILTLSLFKETDSFGTPGWAEAYYAVLWFSFLTDMVGIH
jgi:hypothetical protein